LFYQGLVPQLILLDLIMPEMDGWSTFNRIKAIVGLHDIPIAFFYGFNRPERHSARAGNGRGRLYQKAL